MKIVFAVFIAAGLCLLIGIFTLIIWFAYNNRPQPVPTGSGISGPESLRAEETAPENERDHPDWVLTWGGLDPGELMGLTQDNTDDGNGIAVDDSGNVYVTGTAGEKVDYDPGPGTDIREGGGAFLSKFNSKGEYLWSGTWEGVRGYMDPNEGNALVLDRSDNIYVTGVYSGDADFDPGLGTDIHKSGGVFLSKFTSDGNFKWARTWGMHYEKEWDDAYSIACDYSGNIFVTGEFDGTRDMDPGPEVKEYTAKGNGWAYLSSFTPNGDLRWVRTWGPNDAKKYAQAMGVCSDNKKNIYVIGNYDGTVDFDPGEGISEVTAPGWDSQLFLSKFNSKGEFEWVRCWDKLMPERGCSIAVDSANDLFITGEFGGEKDFDPGSGVDKHSSNGEMDLFLIKCNSDGDFKWARTWGGEFTDIPGAVAVGPGDKIWVTGTILPYADLDPTEGVEMHGYRSSGTVFLIELNGDGSFVGARSMGGEFHVRAMGKGLTVDRKGNVYVTGSYMGKVDFDPGPGFEYRESIDGWNDVFLVKFSPY